MIQIIIVAHGELASQLQKSAEMIAGKQPGLHALDRGLQDSLADMRLKIDGLVKRAGAEDGVLLLTDMVGGTPCNASVPACGSVNFEVLAGVNLPMVLSAVFAGKNISNVSELAAKVLADGQKSIVDVKKMFLSRMKK